MVLPGLEVVLLQWLLRGRTARVAADSGTGRRRLSYSRRYRWTVAGFSAVAAGFLAMGIAVSEKGVALVVIYYLVFGPLAVVFFYAFYDAFFVEISFSESGLFLGRSRTQFIPWGAIAEVRYVSIIDWFVFRAPNTAEVGVSIYRDGLLTLAEAAGRGLVNSPAGGLPPLFWERAEKPLTIDD